MSDEAAMEYLNEHDLCYLATASRSGNPHVSPMFYACEGTKIYFSAPPGSETDRWLKENPIGELVVSEMPADWSQAKGVQIEGPVTELDGDEETHAGELFKARYPFLGDGAMHTHYWRLDAEEIVYLHTDSASADETSTSLGQTWAKSKA
jgi:nitroimidazol reductase NimA-like FMN-containing flavoprotein (pyridoxamine 5'-phosphate oxidase superfamily)